jgi:hypothetical protein
VFSVSLSSAPSESRDSEYHADCRDSCVMGVRQDDSYRPLACVVPDWVEGSARFKPENASAMVLLMFRLIEWLSRNKARVKEMENGACVFSIHSDGHLHETSSYEDSVELCKALHARKELFHVFEKVMAFIVQGSL